MCENLFFFFYTFHPEAKIYKPHHVMTDSAHDYRRVAHVSAGPEHGWKHHQTSCNRKGLQLALCQRHRSVAHTLCVHVKCVLFFVCTNFEYFINSFIYFYRQPLYDESGRAGTTVWWRPLEARCFRTHVTCLRLWLGWSHRTRRPLLRGNREVSDQLPVLQTAPTVLHCPPTSSLRSR